MSVNQRQIAFPACPAAGHSGCASQASGLFTLVAMASNGLLIAPVTVLLGVAPALTPHPLPKSVV